MSGGAALAKQLIEGLLADRQRIHQMETELSRADWGDGKAAMEIEEAVYSLHLEWAAQAEQVLVRAFTQPEQCGAHKARIVRELRRSDSCWQISSGPIDRGCSSHGMLRADGTAGTSGKYAPAAALGSVSGASQGGTWLKELPRTTLIRRSATTRCRLLEIPGDGANDQL